MADTIRFKDSSGRYKYEEALPPKPKGLKKAAGPERERYFDPRTRKTAYRDVAPQVKPASSKASTTNTTKIGMSAADNAKADAWESRYSSGPTKAAAAATSKSAPAKAAPAVKAATPAKAQAVATAQKAPARAKATTSSDMVSPGQRARAASAAKSSAGFGMNPEYGKSAADIARQKRIDDSAEFFKPRLDADAAGREARMRGAEEQWAKEKAAKGPTGLKKGGIVPTKPVKPASSKGIMALTKGIKSAIKPARPAKPFAKGGAVSKTVKQAAPKSAVKSSKAVNGIAKRGLTKAR